MSDSDSTLHVGAARKYIAMGADGGRLDRYADKPEG